MSDNILFIQSSNFCQQMADEEQDLISVVQANKSQSSLRVTIPKRIADELELSHGSFVGFYRVGTRIAIKKVR